jgi:2-hydroxy-3-keto-5-methylthiopentenyl-1-phosphate phosphatase
VKEQLDPTIPADRSLAVFCDFDGTFSVEDVGSTLARQRLAERRQQLWSRFEKGEFTAWSYAVELFDGFELPQAELVRFLHTITLDPGARALVAWCAAQRVPFEILSDGFDWNLERLQEIHGVHFAFRANHLEYQGDRWRIAPGGPNPECGCGTGTCKRSLISAYRKKHPAAFCVHIGNGRVSDLCGAVEADLAFAKDTLVDALRARGRAFIPFTTLDDVRLALEAGLRAGRESGKR